MAPEVTLLFHSRQKRMWSFVFLVFPPIPSIEQTPLNLWSNTVTGTVCLTKVAYCPCPQGTHRRGEISQGHSSRSHQEECAKCSRGETKISLWKQRRGRESFSWRCPLRFSGEVVCDGFKAKVIIFRMENGKAWRWRHWPEKATWEGEFWEHSRNRKCLGKTGT